MKPKCTNGKDLCDHCGGVQQYCELLIEGVNWNGLCAYQRDVEAERERMKTAVQRMQTSGKMKG